MITEIKNGLIYTEGYGLSPFLPHCIRKATIEELQRERRILLVKYLEFDENTPEEIRQEHRELDEKIARLIDSKCRENK